MDIKALKNCSQLAEKQCANFIDGNCMGEGICPIASMNGLRCPYFEKAVLPIANDEVQESYWANVDEVYSYKEDKNVKTASSKKCGGCNRIFKTKNYRLKYCSDACRKSAKNKSTRESKWKKSAIIQA